MGDGRAKHLASSGCAGGRGLILVVLGLAGSALAAGSPIATTRGGLPQVSDAPIGSPAVTGLLGRSTFSITGAFSQHDGTDQHLPPTQQNIELVSKLEMVTPGYRCVSDDTAGDAVVPGQIADVAVHKGYAYLNSWAEDRRCMRGGMFIVDINNPTTSAAGRASFRRCEGPLPRRGRARRHAEHAGVPGRRAGGQQRAVLELRLHQSRTPAHGRLRPLRRDRTRATPETLVQGIGDTGPERRARWAPTRRPKSSHSTSSSGRTTRDGHSSCSSTTSSCTTLTSSRSPTRRIRGRSGSSTLLSSRGPGRGHHGLGAALRRSACFLHDMVVKKIGDRLHHAGRLLGRGLRDGRRHKPRRPDRSSATRRFDGFRSASRASTRP